MSYFQNLDFPWVNPLIKRPFSIAMLVTVSHYQSMNYAQKLNPCLALEMMVLSTGHPSAEGPIMNLIIIKPGFFFLEAVP